MGQAPHPVSIHAPREGCDEEALPAGILLPVSIHAPREGCDFLGSSPIIPAIRFQFTHPGRGATELAKELAKALNVSIHAPREGCDFALACLWPKLVVSIHAPREGCDTATGILECKTTQFQFTHPGRGATPNAWNVSAPI